MDEFPVRTPGQLPGLLQAFRQQAGLTQRDAALRLGVTQQTYSALERKADNIGAARLLALLNLLGVELVLRGATAAPGLQAVPGGPAPAPVAARARAPKAGARPAKSRGGAVADPDAPVW